MASLSFPATLSPSLYSPRRSTNLPAWFQRATGSKASNARRRMGSLRLTAVRVASAMTTEMPKERHLGEEEIGFVEEMRAVSMKLHTRDQAKEGEREPNGKPVSKWEPTVEGYIRFLVDSKVVYDTLEKIVSEDDFPSYAKFRNTGLERSEALAKDLGWFKEQGHVIPETSTPGLAYFQYLNEISMKDPQAFICHFYNIYFAHTAGGHIIGKKVAKILNGKELEFYKWGGDLRKMMQNVKEKLNEVAMDWSREEKDHCLEETEKTFDFLDDLLRLILS